MLLSGLRAQTASWFPPAISSRISQDPLFPWTLKKDSQHARLYSVPLYLVLVSKNLGSETDGVKLTQRAGSSYCQRDSSLFLISSTFHSGQLFPILSSD